MKKIFKAIADFFKKLFGRKRKPKIKYTPINNFEDWSDFEKSILNLINKYRESLGKNPVTAEKAGWEQAKLRVEFQKINYAENGQISHDQYGVAYNNLKNLGFSNIAEILAYGYSSAESVVNAWINSDGHNKILIGNFTKVGISQDKNEQGRNFYCGLFFN